MQTDYCLEVHANYFHYLAKYYTFGQRYNQYQRYASQYEVKKYTLTLQKNDNFTDCGLHIIAYYNCMNAWYGITTGVIDGQERLSILLDELIRITAREASEVRTPKSRTCTDRHMIGGRPEPQKTQKSGERGEHGEEIDLMVEDSSDRVGEISELAEARISWTQ